MISDWTIYAVHVGSGEWLCTSCLEDWLSEEGLGDLGMSAVRQLWLAGRPLLFTEGNEDTAIQPMISLEIDDEQTDSEEVRCGHCGKSLYNTPTDKDDETPSE